MTASAEFRLAERRLGTTLRDKYRLERVIGVGGMAAVYAATHRNRRQFAVKMLHAELSGREEVRVRFQREGYLANTVGHPGTVAVLDDDVAEDGSAFLVMELLDGLGIDSVAEENGGRLPVREVLGIVHQLLDVLAMAHGKGIIHRDIKPANLFLDRSGSVKVLDFGIARIREATQSHLATGTGTTLGTPAFMAPEQALGSTSEVEARTDLWAVGATLFTLVSGVLVHEGVTAAQILVYAATRPARSLASVVPDVPAEIAALSAHALEFEKENRFGSAAEMQAEVARVHQLLFGDLPSKERLAPLSSRVPLSFAPTEHSAPPLSATASVAVALPSVRPSVAGTGKPLSMTPAQITTEPKKRVGVTAAVFAAVCLIAAVVWWRWRAAAPEEGPTATAASTGSALAATPAGVSTSETPAIPHASPDVQATATPVETAKAVPVATVASAQPASSHPHQHGAGGRGSQSSPSSDKEHAAPPENANAEPHNPLEMHIQ